MRIIFAGTPAFAVRVLDAVVQAGHDVALALCQPDRPAGRGQRLVAPPVKQRALELGLALAQPERLRDEAALAMLQAVRADLMLVVAYGLILPQSVLDLARLGCVNVHASLLPRWRGAAPIQRAIEAGDRQTGITIMQMDAGLDSGPILLAEPLSIGIDETGGQLHDRLAELGAALAVRALDALDRRVITAQAQPEAGVTYARKIERADTLIDWNESAADLANRIRALDPAPGCVSALASAPGQPIKLWRARALRDTADGAAPGAVLAAEAGELRVACGEGVLALDIVQRAGAKRQSVAEFLRGRRLPAGERFVTLAR